MLSIVFIILCIFLVLFIFKNKTRIDVRSFFLKGFKKKDDMFGLYTYTGKQGQGITYSAVKFVTKMARTYNYKVITNIKSYNAFDDIIYISDIIDLINFVNENTNDLHDRKCKYLIFFDEIFTVLMKGQSINTTILAFLAQLRKRGIIFVTTAQEWSEIPLTFRRFCRFQISCNMYSIPLLDLAIQRNLHNDGYNVKWDDKAQEFVAPLMFTKIAKCNKYVVDLYDTFETINTQKVVKK